MPRSLRVISWNVNGLRACEQKGFARWLTASRAAIVGVQEVRALPAQIPESLCRLRGWHSCFFPAQRLGYSGVGLFSRAKPDAVDTALEARFDVEGRLQIARFGELHVVNAYFPKGSGKERDNSRVPYKLDFYRALFARLEPLRRRGARVLVMGDFNTAHCELDLARPRQNLRNSGFLPEERAELDRWLAAGWVDTFRHFVPEGGHYTWWRQWGDARAQNVGWRIDYVLASPGALPFVTGAFIDAHVLGSDHCPVGVKLDARALG